MSKFVPNGWENQRLDELSKVVDSAHQTPIFSNFGIPMVRVGDINGGKVSLANTKLVTDDIYRIFAKNHEPKFNDVLMTRVGSYGRSSIVKTSKKFCLGQNTVVISPRKMNSDFLYQFLQTENINNQIEDTVGGSSQKSLSLGAIKSLRVLTPPFPEQQKITKILTSVDDVIEKTQAQIDKLKDLKTGMMQELLTNGIGHTEFKDSPVGRIPAEWNVVRVGEIVTKVGSGVTPKGGSKAYVSSGIPLIRSQNVHSDGLRLDNVSFITAEQHQKMKGSQLQSNDVLLNITGASIGRCYYLADDFIEGNVNQHVCIIRLKKHKVSHVFITLLLNGQLGQTQIMSLQAGGNREGLNFQQIREIKLPLPPIEEQVKISNTLSSIERKIRIKESKLNAVIKIKKALMQDLLTGKVRVKVDSE